MISNDSRGRIAKLASDK